MRKDDILRVLPSSQWVGLKAASGCHRAPLRCMRVSAALPLPVSMRPDPG